MGNAKFFYYPQPDGRHLVQIDLGEAIAELQSEIVHDAVDAITQTGGIYRSVSRGGEIITIQRDRMAGSEALATQFDALQNHLDRGYSCMFVTDHAKAWCAAFQSPPVSGKYTYDVKDAVFSTITGTTVDGSSIVPQANDYVVIESDTPPYIRETHQIESIAVSATTGGSVTLKKRLNFDYSGRPVFMRWYRMFPVLKRLESDIGTPIITNEGGRLFSLNIRLQVDYQTYFAFHNGLSLSLELVTEPSASGDIEDAAGRFTLDGAGQASQERANSQFDESIVQKGSGPYSKTFPRG
jgi:hypothetical protein